MTIPKKIHYIWFGGEKNEIAKRAIETWKKRAPKYQIVEWNEYNLPNYKNKFYQAALKNKDYAFASDYARLEILKKYGGVYMDTDMYLLKDPIKILKDKELVFSIQDRNVIISTSFIAAQANQTFIKEALKIYDTVSYRKGFNKPNTELLSPLIFRLYGFKNEDRVQLKGRVVAFGSDVLLQPTFRAVAMHIGEKSWESHSRHDNMRILLRKHIQNRLEAGIFSFFNNIGRRIF